jgi:DNA-binding helix-hairpin-helix protein with protein kinase domain
VAGRRALLDSEGRAIELGPPLASGGEGTVCAVGRDAALLAKVYHQAPEARQVEKLHWMTGQATPELCRFAGWPTATLHDTPGGPVVGFLMPRFNGYRPIHTLYSPAHRRASFPQADWAFLAHTARNCASAFDAVHAAGHVIGDVNQSNVLVSEQGLVCLIDCDSFQVRAAGRVFPCEVGVGPYTPSELQGQNLRDVVRTANHDNFGLAVLIFHLLFMGRHPFAGRFLGDGEMPLERAVQEFRFVYSEAGPGTDMTPPPFALPLHAVSPELARLFERAFDRGAERDARPAPAEWHAALGAFLTGLRPCPRQPGHKVPAHRTDCPWCAIVAAGGPDFFLGVGLAGGTFIVDRAAAAAIWRRVEAVPLRRYKLGPLQAPPGAALAPARLSWQARLARKAVPRIQGVGCLTWLVVALVGYLVLQGLVGQLLGALLPLLAIGAVAFWAAWWQVAFEEEKKRRAGATEGPARRLEALRQEWQQVVTRYKDEHARLRAAAQKLKDRYDGLQAEFDAERTLTEDQSVREREARARDDFLRTRFLSDYKVPGIGPGRQVLLESYGVETAADVTEEALRKVRGIGPVLRDNLLAWREAMLADYRPPAGTGPPPAEAPRALVFKYKQLEEGLRAQLQRGAIDLESLAGHTEEQLRELRARLDQALVEAAQAERDREALSG